jgi:hypothetical protein
MDDEHGDLLELRGRSVTAPGAGKTEFGNAGSSGLAQERQADMVRPQMSSAEIIEMIKKLPPKEKAEVIAFARNQQAVSGTGEEEIRHIPDETFAKIAPKVFEKHKDLLRRLAQ